MAEVDDRKVHSTDIVNGLARKDILDSKGILLVKKGTRISEAHYARMREEGLVQDDKSKSKNQNNFDINFVSSKSLHGRLEKVVVRYAQLQTKMVEEANASLKSELESIISDFSDLCDENIHQILGELFLSEIKKYHFIKPLYIAASITELIKRYNSYAPDKQVTAETKQSILQAALLYNTGLIQSNKNIYDDNLKLSVEEKQELRKNYPTQSIATALKMGVADPITLDAIKNHNTVADDVSFEALVLRTPFIYAGIALPENKEILANNMFNPCKVFTRLFAEKKLDPVIGGLFLKINGIAPIGSILNFESREKGVVIKGPNSENVTSSLVRIITNKSSVQLRKPGERFYLHQTKMVQKGLSDHHQFAWGKFAPFVTWER